MESEDKIKYSDIIEPDDSLDRLVKELSEINKTFGTLASTIKEDAAAIVRSLKSVSGATEEGRKEIDKAAGSAERVKRAWVELQFAQSKTGKQLADYKARIAEVNRESVLHAQQLRSEAGSIKMLKADLKLAEDEYERLSEAKRKNSKEAKFLAEYIRTLKQELKDARKATELHRQEIQYAADSYSGLNRDLKSSIDLYRSLSKAERENAEGQSLLDSIHQTRVEIQELDAALKPHVEQLTEVQKLEQQLAYWQSEEGQKALELKQQIKEITQARQQQKAAVDPVTAAEQKLANIESEEARQLRELNAEIKQKNKIADLEAKIAISAEGSYNQLSAQYELNKIKLNEMSAAEREGTEAGRALEEETFEIYQKMIKLQEATGNFKLSVGNYKTAFNGLSFSINQVVRELPSLAISANTFFLAISNNIPMVVDEINKVRKANKEAIEQGKPTQSVIKSITSAMFGWNTVLVLVLTALSLYGKQIIGWIKDIGAAKKEVLSLTEALSNMQKELEKNAQGYGDNITTLRKLQREWERVKGTVDEGKWIKAATSELSKLGIAAEDAADIENALINNTDALVESFKLRAKAAAAAALAAKAYEESLSKEAEAENVRQRLKEGTPTFWDELRAVFSWKSISAGLMAQEGAVVRAAANNSELQELVTPLSTEESMEQHAQNLEDKAAEIAAGAEVYNTLNEQFLNEIDAIFEKFGFKSSNLSTGRADKGEKKLRDLIDTINNMFLKTQKEYEASKTALMTDEFDRRRRASEDEISANIRDLENRRDKIARILANEDGKYKELTEEQKERVRQTQEWIVATIENYQKQLSKTLEDIEIDRQVKELSIVEETVKKRLDIVQKGTDAELELRKRAIELQRQRAILENAKLPENEQLSDDLINEYYDSKLLRLTGDISVTRFKDRQAVEKAEFEATKHSATEVSKFKLRQEKELLEEQIRLAEEGALNWSAEQIEAAKLTVQGINRELDELSDPFALIGKKGLGYTLLDMLGFDEDQIDALKQAVDIVVDQLGEIADAEVELAEKAVEASEKRIDALKSAYDAEVEARNNGYANNVATAKKELQLEKEKHKQQLKMLEEAERRKEALDTISQASSLVTASANLWAVHSKMPGGAALALAAIAAMWTSFAAAKIKARQVTRQSQEYGEGGLEFLQGGSHASGNDIDLGVNNQKKRRMRAEGGEALAIINKRQTRKYRKILPDVISSFNKGVFEDKYGNAFASPEGLSLTFNSNHTVDLSKIEEDVRSIKKQNEIRYYTLPDGTVVKQYRNVKRIIKNS